MGIQTSSNFQILDQPKSTWRSATQPRPGGRHGIYGAWCLSARSPEAMAVAPSHLSLGFSVHIRNLNIYRVYSSKMFQDQSVPFLFEAQKPTKRLIPWVLFAKGTRSVLRFAPRCVWCVPVPSHAPSKVRRARVGTGAAPCCAMLRLCSSHSECSNAAKSNEGKMGFP